VDRLLFISADFAVTLIYFSETGFFVLLCVALEAAKNVP